MRGATIGRLLVWVPLAALLCGSPARADEGPYTQVRGWSLYRNQTNCSAFMMFENDVAVGFTYDAPGRSTRVTFSGARAPSLTDGDSQSLDILLRRPDGTVENAWESTIFIMADDEDGRRTYSSRWLGPPALEHFREAAFVGFFDEDREIGVFSLRGSAAALDEVKQCSMELRAIVPPE